ncbi:hypothetical protein [Streptomyces sp. INR7]|uniref:hypothetical protein n=1 Tax=Streptomyces sp. INR7 TaxID=2607753 RepID=UPI0016237E69|nr:hypothetical protein [Streptomyces sp. INR7]QNE24112.1 ABC transporter permease [Streptomyces sp. INR7]
MTPTQLADRAPTAPIPAPRSAGRTEIREARSRRKRLLARYLGYVGYFVGAGLISGAVVHHPLDPARYTRIALYGVLVFLAATALNEFLLTRRKPTFKQVAGIMGASLLLSFGIGMLSGGLQHFEDFPTRAATLIPAGILLSFIAYVIKDEDASWRRIFGLAGLAVLLTAVAAFAGLRYVASSMAPESGGHSHGTGTGQSETHHEEPPVTSNTQPTPQSQPSTPARTTPATPPAGQSHDDGHAHGH